MKLILCTKCHDVVKLRVSEERQCRCGASRGRYEQDGWSAWFSGKHAVPLGIINQSLTRAVISQKLMGPILPVLSDAGYPDMEFKAIVFPEGHERFERRDET
ncbi:MAG: hypothetical protein ACREIS_05640 [Nitrospiraceae bacterium]